MTGLCLLLCPTCCLLPNLEASSIRFQIRSIFIDDGFRGQLIFSCGKLFALSL